MSTWADAIDESQKQWKKRKAEQEPDNALPCGHDVKWRVGSPDDPGGTVGCELCEEIGKERDKLFSLAIRLKPDRRRTNHDFDVGFEEACRLFARAIRRGEY